MKTLNKRKLNIPDIPPMAYLNPIIPIIMDENFSRDEKTEFILQVMDSYAHKIYGRAYVNGLNHSKQNSNEMLECLNELTNCIQGTINGATLLTVPIELSHKIGETIKKATL